MNGKMMSPKVTADDTPGINHGIPTRRTRRPEPGKSCETISVEEDLRAPWHNP
jgi:hypothetical protein